MDLQGIEPWSGKVPHADLLSRRIHPSPCLPLSSSAHRTTACTPRPREFSRSDLLPWLVVSHQGRSVCPVGRRTKRVDQCITFWHAGGALLVRFRIVRQISEMALRSDSPWSHSQGPAPISGSPQHRWQPIRQSSQRALSTLLDPRTRVLVVVTDPLKEAEPHQVVLMPESVESLYNLPLHSSGERIRTPIIGTKAQGPAVRRPLMLLSLTHT